MFRQPFPAPHPREKADHLLALPATLLQPGAPQQGLDREPIAGIFDQSIGGDEEHACEAMRLVGPPVQRQPTPEAVADQRAAKGQSFLREDAIEGLEPIVGTEGPVVARGTAVCGQVGHDQCRVFGQQWARGEHVFERTAEAVEGQGGLVHLGCRSPDGVLNGQPIFIEQPPFHALRCAFGDGIRGQCHGAKVGFPRRVSSGKVCGKRGAVD